MWDAQPASGSVALHSASRLWGHWNKPVASKRPVMSRIGFQDSELAARTDVCWQGNLLDCVGGASDHHLCWQHG